VKARARKKLKGIRTDEMRGMKKGPQGGRSNAGLDAFRLHALHPRPSIAASAHTSGRGLQARVNEE